LGGDGAETGILVCRVKETKDLPENNPAMPWHGIPKMAEERATRCAIRVICRIASGQGIFQQRLI